MVNTTDFTKFGIHNDAERYAWVTYTIFVSLSSLIGDSLILYASFQRDAFKLNKFIVAIIQHIAVCDLGYTISSIIPITTSLIADAWVLGDAMCYARVYLGHFIYPAGLFQITFLTTSKMLLVKYPIRCSHWTSKRAHAICCSLTTVAVTFPLLIFGTDKHDIKFDYKIYTCDFMYTPTIWKWLQGAVSAVNHFAPNIIIVATTIPTLMYLAAARKSAKRVRGSVPWQGALTVALTAIISCLSNIPNITAEIVIDPLVKNNELLVQFRVQSTRIGKYFLFINIMSNFYIYTLTIKSFRRFLRAKITSILSKFSQQVGTVQVANVGKNDRNHILHGLLDITLKI